MRQRTFDLLAVVGVFAAYTITIRLAMGLDLVGCLLGGAANTIPVVIFGVAVRRIVAQRLVGRPAGAQLVVHLVLCAAYTALSYLLLIVLLGLFNGAGPEGFVVRPFSLSGAAWQSLENVTTYALIAAVSYLQAMGRAHVAVTAPPTSAVEKAVAAAPDAPAAEPEARAEDRTLRHPLQPGQPITLAFQSQTVTARLLPAGSRIVAVVGVPKIPQIQINYGTGRDVSDESIADAGDPLRIRWLAGSYLELGMRGSLEFRHLRAFFAV